MKRGGGGECGVSYKLTFCAYGRVYTRSVAPGGFRPSECLAVRFAFIACELRGYQQRILQKEKLSLFD